MSWFDAVRQALVLAGGVGALTFPAYYWWANPRWYQEEMSRFLMFGGLGWASLYSSAFIAILLPGEITREIIRLVLIVGAGSFAWYQVWMLWRVRKEEKERRRQ